MKSITFRQIAANFGLTVLDIIMVSLEATWLANAFRPRADDDRGSYREVVGPSGYRNAATERVEQ